jgi:hypothetical protein
MTQANNETLGFFKNLISMQYGSQRIIFEGLDDVLVDKAEGDT